MLIQFRFKNFKSFRDDTILDLSATKNTEYSDRVIIAGYEKLLPMAAIFGANASGKSNVIEAFRYMMTYVVESFSYGDDQDNKKSMIKRLKPTPFLFDAASKDAESVFEVYFIGGESNGYRSYNYGFALNQQGVVEEWLNSKAKSAREYKQVFYRNRDELDLSGLPSKNQELIQMSLNRESLIVSLGAKLKIVKLKSIRDWFYGVNFANFGDPYENVFLSTAIPSGFAEDKTVRDNVIKYFASFDNSIVDFNVEVKKKENGERRKVIIDAIHRTVDGGRVSIPLEKESGGTLKMFALYSALQDTMENGGVLFIDELNARLHPLLVRSFLITFLNPEINTKHAQLIFTTHDSWQLSNNLLRRDEIWFTEKDENGASSLYSLADFVDEEGVKIRKDESYEKNYLLGKYGAIPTLKYFDMLGGK